MAGRLTHTDVRGALDSAKIKYHKDTRTGWLVSPKSWCNAAAIPAGCLACLAHCTVRRRQDSFKQKAWVHQWKVMRKAANGRARTDAQRQDMPSSTNKLPIHSAWYFRSACLLCSCPHPHEGQLLTSWSWRPGAAGDARKLGLKRTPASARLTLQLLRAAKHKQIGREEKKKEKS